MSDPEDIIRRNAAQLVPGASRRPIVYVHGYGCGQTVWRPLVQRNAGLRPQVLLDLAGHGAAAPDAFDAKRYPDLDAYARDVLEVCETFGVTSNVTLVGHSIGCNIAMRAAMAYPDWFSGLVLVGASPCFLDRDDYRGGFSEDDLEGLLDLLERNPTAWAGNLASIVAGGRGETEVWLRESFCSMDPVSAQHFARLTFFVDDRSLLPDVRVPAIVVHHGHDALVPLDAARFMVQRMPAARLVTLAVSGHAAHMTHPHLVADLLDRETV